MKKYFLTGLILILPITMTLIIIFFLFDFFTTPFINIFGPIIKQLPIPLPQGLTLFLSRVFALIFLCIFILFLGVITQWLLVRNFLHGILLFLTRIPVINTVYRVSKDIFTALLSPEGTKAFKRPVMIPFPSKPNYCLGFEAGIVAKECQEKINKPLVSVFAPTAPHPISGFLFLIQEEDVQPVDMTNEEVVKFLVSCGIIVPESDTPKNEIDEYL
jgi:uncharacterized membrane protein